MSLDHFSDAICVFLFFSFNFCPRRITTKKRQTLERSRSRDSGSEISWTLKLTPLKVHIGIIFARESFERNFTDRKIRRDAKAKDAPAANGSPYTVDILFSFKEIVLFEVLA